MKSIKRNLLFLLISLMLVSFLSAPVFSGGGDEDPWDADNSGDYDGTTTDTIDFGAVVYSTDEGTGGDFNPYSDLIFTISFELANLLFGDQASSISSTSGSQSGGNVLNQFGSASN